MENQDLNNLSGSLPRFEAVSMALPPIVPQRLQAVHRESLERHFLALGAEDRRLRFGANPGDAGVRAYVARIDFERDEVFAVADGDLVLQGVIHVAFTGDEAELGLSVLPGHRGRGVGTSLFERAVVHLRNRGTRKVFVHCLAENEAMLHLSRKHGMQVVSDGVEREAFLLLLPPTLDTFLHEWAQDERAAAIKP